MSVDPGIELGLIDGVCDFEQVRARVRVRVMGLELGVGLRLGLDLHFAVWVSVLQSRFMQLLSACGVCESVDAIFDLVPLDEAPRCSLCWDIYASYACPPPPACPMGRRHVGSPIPACDVCVAP